MSINVLAESANVFLALPSYGDVKSDVIFSLFNATSPNSRTKVDVHLRGSSALTFNFNQLWCEALNKRKSEGFTHFVMLHSDVSPSPGWVDVLLDELWAHNCDVVSAVIPLKDTRGVTTTAIGKPDSLDVVRRLTVREARKLPRTFSAADAGYPGAPLLINTGCWVCDLRSPWVDKFPGFTVVDSIRYDSEKDERIARFFPEDWHFGLWLYAHGVKAKATTAVSLTHHGAMNPPYRNDYDWGLAADPMDGTPLPALGNAN